jgi:hypothetical protein
VMKRPAGNFPPVAQGFINQVVDNAGPGLAGW